MTNDVAFPPRPKGTSPTTVILTGCFMPIGDDNTILLNSPGSEHLYLPVFQTVDALRAFLEDLDAPYTRVSEITDGRLLLENLPPAVKIIVDPHMTAEGTVEWLEVMSPDSEETLDPNRTLH